MFELICKCFIKDYKNVENGQVREKYGTVFSIISIFLNIVMVIFKLIISYITNSISIRADALNNLSDVGSNLATLFGFKLSNKHPDADHPYGHGRMEYVSGLIVSMLILMMGFSALKDSFMKIIHPEEVVFSSAALIVLTGSIIIKLLMAYLNKMAGKTINSDAIKAAGQDSINDSIVTGATLICLLILYFININVDTYLGIVASALVLKSGVDIFKDVLDTILGRAPDKQLIKRIEEDVCSYDGVLGIHDLMLHDYGPSQQFMSLHVETDSRIPVIEMHDTIDNIERFILDKYSILTTIHMDPIDTKDALAIKLKEDVNYIIKKINNNYTFHDFRVVRGPTHTNLVFDVVLPAEDKNDIEELRKQIQNDISKIDNTYYCVINFDRSFV